MPKNNSLGRNRSVSVKKQGGDLHITIAEEGSDVKTVTLPSRRWAQFMEARGQVDEAVNNLIAHRENLEGALSCIERNQFFDDLHRFTPA